MSNVLCRHRPGRELGHERYSCRYCGVGVEACPCDSPRKRSEEPCRACAGGQWVAIVRGGLTTFREICEDRS